MPIPKPLRRLAASLAAAVLLTALAATGLLDDPGAALSDALCQRPQAQSGRIVLLGIDQRSLEEIGPWPWPRDVLAQTIDLLNADADNRPAVIGVDALLVGDTDRDADLWLAEAASKYGNVVTASAATFGARFTQAGDAFYMDDYAVLSYDQPYPALREATKQGHINAMYDNDGVIRHSILWVTPGERVYSFAWVIAGMYSAYAGLPPPAEPPCDARGRWYLPFTAMPGAYDSGLSVADALSGDLPYDHIAGKIVLIGPYAAGLQDAYPTAIDHAQAMYGVEIQANAIEALLRGEYKREAPKAAQWALLFAAAFAAMLFFWDRRVLPATFVCLLAALAWPGLCALAYGWGWVVHPLHIPLAVALTYIAAVAANYARTLREKRHVTNTFKRYVDPSVMAELLKEGSQSLGLGGKQCDIAVLFVDIRGFTPLSEALEAATVVEILNRYLSLTTACVMRHQGTLDKFVGDCTMAIWNAPLRQDDYVMRACRAALDMVEGAKALGEELLAKYGKTVSFGVGVHCGPAVVGNIGAQMRMDFTAIGDTVNTAARLEANAPAGQIYISRAVADALAGRIRATSLGGSVRLKGKAEGFEVLALEGVRS